MMLAARHCSTSKWIEHGIDLKNADAEIRGFLRQHPRADWDLYWCPNPFRNPRRTRANAMSTPFGWCDIDRAPWTRFRPMPNVVWGTSPGRTQGLWLWHRFETPGRAEAYSRALAYKHRGDRNGWSYTKLLRIPFTFNHKPEYRRPEILIERFKTTPQRRRPKFEFRKYAPGRKGVIGLTVNPQVHYWHDVVEKYRGLLPWDRYSLMKHNRVLSGDRSRCIFMIVQALHDAGASPDQIASVVWRSPYFIDKHGHRIERLEAEIARILGKLGGAR